MSDSAAASAPSIEADLGAFVGIVRHYFAKVGREPAALRAASLEFVHPDRLDFTGYIEVSGRARGWIGLSLPRGLLDEVLDRMREPRRDDEAYRDLVGEMATTITGNAREHFGPRLALQPPITVGGNGAADAPASPPLLFKLPFDWHGHGGYLLIALHDQP